MFIEKNWVISVTGLISWSDIISEQSYLYTKYDIDQETIAYALDKMNELTWITTVRMEQLPLSIMFLALEKDKEY